MIRKFLQKLDMFKFFEIKCTDLLLTMTLGSNLFIMLSLPK